MVVDFHLGILFTTEAEVDEGGITFISPFSHFFSNLLSGTSGKAETVKLSEAVVMIVSYRTGSNSL